jgi:hypothetical protein
MRVELLIEGFNVFNRSNYNGFGTTLYTAAASSPNTLLATPIKPTPTAGFFAPNNDGTPPDGTNARRLQLSIRFLRVRQGSCSSRRCRPRGLLVLRRFGSLRGAGNRGP